MMALGAWCWTPTSVLNIVMVSSSVVFNKGAMKPTEETEDESAKMAAIA